MIYVNIGQLLWLFCERRDCSIERKYALCPRAVGGYVIERFGNKCWL